MTIESMRAQIADVYSGPMWRTKVRDMPDRQVIAIFHSMVDEGRLYRHDGKQQQKSPEFCEQLTIWDLLPKSDTI